MARKHARILVSIWDDDEFTALEPAAQVLYFAVLSSKDISWCGVNPLLPQRFSRISAGMNERKAQATLTFLDQRRFLVIDRDTAEVAARTFVRHDDILSQPNVTKAMGRALGVVRSERIRASILSELARALRDDPEAKGWPALKSAYPDLFTEVGEMALPNPSSNPSQKAS